MEAAGGVRSREQCEHCDHSSHTPSSSHSLYEMMKKASAIFLAIFSAYTAFSYFMPCFLVGLAIGSFIQLKKNHHSHGFMSSCSQGIVGYLGYDLPAPIAVACDITITVIHIDHHPIIAGIIGLQVATWVAHLGKQWLHRDVKAIPLNAV